MSLVHLIVPFILVLNTIQYHAMPTGCRDLNCKNYMRTQILDRLETQALPDALKLKEMAGKGIPFRLKLDASPPFEGFPEVQNSENCTVSEIQNCFNEDCQSLRTLIHFIETELMEDFRETVSNIKSQIEAVVEQMDCINVNSISIPNITYPIKTEKNYCLAKDTVVFLQYMTMKYTNIVW